MKKYRFSRRGFLKSSVIGATGLVVGQKAFARTSNRSSANSEAEPIIIYRTLGKTGIRLPIVSIKGLNSWIRLILTRMAGTRKCWERY
jgi:hypothetical protein